MLVHRCDHCCVYKKEIQPCRTKYRGIWAILMHKMVFTFESCNSVSKCSFREFRPFSVIAENHWPYSMSEKLREREVTINSLSEQLQVLTNQNPHLTSTLVASPDLQQPPEPQIDL